MSTGNNPAQVIRRLISRTGGGITAGRGKFTVTMDAIIVLLTPLTLLAVAVYYEPIVGTGLKGLELWANAAVILIFMFVSLFLHSLAHNAAAGTGISRRVYLSPLGDPAQSQPAALSSGKEALTALAGPLTQCLLAILFYVLWNAQINEFTNTASAFLIFFNLGLGVINLIPVFPFDGGRILRAVTWKLLGKPGAATKLAVRLGWGLCAGLAVWSIKLFLPYHSFSLQTGGGTIFFALLTVLSLVIYKIRNWEEAEPIVRTSKKALTVRAVIVGVLMLPLAVIGLSLLPLNQGLEAPGFTASVEPMVRMPEEYRHDSSGSLILLTVIPQAPIITGEWVYAHFDHTIRLTPPEEIIPKDKTAQTLSEENYRMLLDSETTAIIVGLRLAGFAAEVNDAGVRIISVLTNSPANAIVQPEDIITGMNGSPVVTPADLIAKLKLLTVQSILKMNIMRAGNTLTLDVPTMEPQKADGEVKIGITIEQYTSGYTLPFPVEIVTEKVSGGPSAGLMFTLGVYNLLTEGDLTGGRKIAGTGTIDLEGNVGPIGGVQQKVAAAERAGAEYFLVPAENYADALGTATHIKVIKVTTAQEAIDFLVGLSLSTF